MSVYCIGCVHYSETDVEYENGDAGRDQVRQGRVGIWVHGTGDRRGRYSARLSLGKPSTKYKKYMKLVLITYYQHL